MSFSYPVQLLRAPACFEASDGSPRQTADPACLLWSPDRALGAKLLQAIAGEAGNRKLSFSAVYDALLPDRMTALSVEGIGNFTLSPDQLTREGGLIDCSACIADPAKSGAFSLQSEHLRAQIAQIGRILSAQNELRKQAAAKITAGDALAARAVRIARHTAKGSGNSSALPIWGYGEGYRVCYFPFDSRTQIIGLPACYNLSDLFLDALADALTKRGCSYTLLTDALTSAPVGIYLAQSGVCYLTEAPADARRKQLTLQRYLLPYTTEGRRAWRQLNAAYARLEAYLADQILAYRAQVRREEDQLSSHYATNRLQNFRKRLLIDLFCKND